jgi:adenosine deaminase
LNFVDGTNENVSVSQVVLELDESIDEGERDEVSESIRFLLIVQEESVVSVSFEFDFDAQFVVGFEGFKFDVRPTVESWCVVLFVNHFSFAKRPRKVCVANASECGGGKINTSTSLMTGG